MRFVQIDPFPHHWEKLGLTDEDLRALEGGIMAGPSGPPPIPGGNGLRKIRFGTPASNVGKRGGYRIYYVHFADFGTVILWAILSKSDRSDLSKDDIHFLGKQITRLNDLLDKGKIR